MDTTFKEAIYELAFGDNAIEKGYTDSEVLSKITDMCSELQRFGDLQDKAFKGCETEEDYEYWERVKAELKSFQESGVLNEYDEQEE